MGDRDISQAPAIKVKMHHDAKKVIIKEGTVVEVYFRNGKVKQYDISVLFDDYPQLAALKNRELFEKGHLQGTSGIVWNDDLDIDIEAVYQEGITVGTEPVDISIIVGEELAAARCSNNMTQKDLAAVTGIDQSDISRIERGEANPSIRTLERLASGMNRTINVAFDEIEDDMKDCCDSLAPNAKTVPPEITPEIMVDYDELISYAKEKGVHPAKLSFEEYEQFMSEVFPGETYKGQGIPAFEAWEAIEKIKP